MRAFLKYYLFWILFFVVQKPLFMLVNIKQMGALEWSDWFLVSWHAFPLDLSVASYITAVFGLLVVGYYLCPKPFWARIADVYTGMILAVALMIFIGDTGVYPYWGFHLDRSIFVYLASPQEMLANAVWWQWLLALIGLIIGWSGYFILYRYLLRGWEGRQIPEGWSRRLVYAGGMLLLAGLLFLPIRGSVTTSTMNTGRVYFSERQALNMAAINPVFNLVESLSEGSFDTQRYTYMSTDEAKQLVAELLPSFDSAPQIMLKTSRPNIVFFILESFSSNAWDAMPCLRRLAEEGIYFSQTYASSFRTDRGVVAILSGFPGQPTSSLMTHPTKSRNLPQLGKSLAVEGYQLKFWYGGDEDFTNMRSYLIEGGFVDRVNDHSFPVSQRLSKWGVPDHLLFARAAEEIRARETDLPTLDVILSLSSHEPFEVPTINRYDHPYLNSIAYTDSCIGAFIDVLRASKDWDNTLLIFVPDHGYPYPVDVQNHEPRRYAIPILWAGGAVKETREVKTLCSQIDLVPTLLAQMGIDHSEYVFGKNVLAPSSIPFSFYSFNDGFALLTSQDSVVIDAKSNRKIIGENTEMERHARAFMQRVMETIDEK